MQSLLSGLLLFSAIVGIMYNIIGRYNVVMCLIIYFLVNFVFILHDVPICIYAGYLHVIVLYVLYTFWS